MRALLSSIALVAGALPVAADELARAEGTWADGSPYTAVLSDDGDEGQARIRIYLDASATPVIDNPHLTGVFENVWLTAEADGTLVLKTHALFPDYAEFNETFVIAREAELITVRRYQIHLGDPTPDSSEPFTLYCDADIAGGRIDWPDMGGVQAITIPTAEAMRLDLWSMSRAVTPDALGICPAYG